MALRPRTRPTRLSPCNPSILRLQSQYLNRQPRSHRQTGNLGPSRSPKLSHTMPHPRRKVVRKHARRVADAAAMVVVVVFAPNLLIILGRHQPSLPQRNQ